MTTTRSLAVVLTALALLLDGLARGGALAQDTPARPPRQGRGENELVLIHGLGANASIWDDALPYLKGTFQVWTYELPGHGSTKPIADPTIVKEAEALRAYLALNDIVYPTLVGHGMGGMIALQYTLDHPADVYRLILIDAGPKQLASPQEKKRVGEALLADYDHFVASRFSIVSDDPDLVTRSVDMALRTDSTTMASLLMSSFDWDVSSRLATLSVPMLLIASQHFLPDPDNKQGYLVEYGFGGCHDLHFKRLDGVGYYAMLEAPVRVAAAILVFARRD